MSSMTCRGRIKFEQDDHWNTPETVWESIAHLIPKKVIWEPFLLKNETSTSVACLKKLGFEVIGDSGSDFFETNCGEVIVSNPPFSIKKKIFERLAVLDKPFMLVVPVSILTKQYLNCLNKTKLQIIIPAKRIHFIKGNDETKRCWYDTLVVCYKIGLEKEITYLA
jgi:hypothetical protein